MPSETPVNDLLSDLEARGLVHDSTDREALRARLSAGPCGVYVGFDPTADSLHVGHLMGQFTLRRFQLAGHPVFPLAGGATGMIGDPSGRSDERNLLDLETLRANTEAIKSQLSKFLDFSPGPATATLVNNADWTAPMSALDFLRDVGKHITVNQMLAKDSVRSRLQSEHGISYTEFSYMLLQANDFRHLRTAHGVEIQAGGSDQWGNITAGTELIRKSTGASAHGFTWPLLTNRDGSKFGKSAGGAVWLDPARTSPYQFRQFWVQVDDDAVGQYLRQFTFDAVEDLETLMASHLADPGRRLAQRHLADRLTELVHGATEAARAEAAAAVLFGADPSGQPPEVLEAVAAEIPCTTVTASELHLLALLVRSGLASSNGDARRGLPQRQFSVNGRKADSDRVLDASDVLPGGFVLVSRGRANHHMIKVVD
jgi:tyrosyl-tRNA synthetase